MASYPPFSLTEEAEEYDLLPSSSSPSSSSSSRSRRLRSSGPASRTSWMLTLPTKLGGTFAFTAILVAGAVLGQILIPTPSPLLPSQESPSSSSQPSPPPPPTNPFTLPGFIVNRPILPPDVDVDKLWGWYDKVRWKPIPSLKKIASGEGRLGRRDRDGSEGEEPVEFEEEEEELPSLLEELKIAHERGRIPEGWHDWGVNKTILGIGDSLMRNNMLFFTQHIATNIGRPAVPFRDEMGSKWAKAQGQWQGVVHVPVVDLKMVNFFHQGMIESPVPGFFANQSLPQNFEEKLSKVFLPALDHPHALNGRVPDLIIFESLSWDLVLLARLSRNYGDQRLDGRPLDNIEMDFLRGRIIEVLGLLRRTFPTTKIILQTPHLGGVPASHVFSPIRNFQQAQIMCSVSLETGIELFDWGGIVSSLDEELLDGLHFRSGVASWIWGEMVLYHLREASLTSVPPPPPAPKLPSSRVTQQDLIDFYSQPKQAFKRPARRRQLGHVMDLDSESESLEAATRLLTQ